MTITLKFGLSITERLFETQRANQKHKILHITSR